MPGEHDAARQMVRKALSFTFVQYEEGDLVGLAMAWVSLVHIIVLVAVASAFVARRELQSLAVGIGLVVNEGVNMVLKRLVFRQERPAGSDRGDFGMPSAHAQFAGFFCTYVALHAVARMPGLARAWRVLAVLASLALALIVAVSRVYLAYHTPEQVIVGLLVGLAVAVPYYALVQGPGRRLFRALAASRLGHWAALRDSSDVPHVQAFERDAVAAYEARKNE